MKFTKRVLALLLALCLTFGNVMPVLAAEVTDEETVSYSTVTFVYAGSNAAVTGSMLNGYVTYGLDEVNANADTLGAIYEASGNSLTMKVDSSKITSTPVWMDMWAEGTSLTWKGVSTNFSGETIYLLDDGTTTLTKPEDSSEEVTYGTVSFVYTGSDASIAAAGWEGWVKGSLEGMATDGLSLTNAGIAATTSGNVVTLTVDKSKVTGDVYLDVYDNATWTHWYFTTQFDGETFYLVDGVSDATTTAPSTSETEVAEPEAAEAQLLAEFTFPDGTNSTWTDGSKEMTSDTTYTSGDYSLTFTGGSKVYSGGNDADNKGFIKFGTGSKVGTVSFTVPDEVNSVVLHLSGYKANAGQFTVNDGDAITLTTTGNNTVGNGSKYDIVTIDTSATKTIKLSTTTSSYRMVMYSVAYYDQVVDMSGTGSYDSTGDDSGDDTTVTLPEDGSTLTIAEVLALSSVLTGDTTEKYYVSGVIKNVYNTTYGNMYITDDAGNELCLYGTYSADGSTSYANMTTKPVAGDTIAVYGILSVYNGAAQVKNGWIVEHTVAPTDDPAADSELTIAEAIALGESKDSGAYTASSYYLTGEITEVQNETYGNVVISDGTDSILIYGLYDNGNNRYDAMSVKPVVGDTIVVYGIIGNYKGTAQMNSGVVKKIVLDEPEDGSTLSVEDAAALAAANVHNAYTTGKFYVTGTVTEVVNSTYGNLYIADDYGNTLYVYGTYDATGENRYDAMTNAPAVGDIITVYGILGQYGGTAQMKNGWVTEHLILGSESNPIDANFTFDEATNIGSLTVTVPANTTNYYQSFAVDGMILSINGVEQDGVLSANRWMMMPAVFSVTNDTDAAAEYTLTVAYPVGSENNPEAIAEGDVTVTLEPYSGYHFSYTAPDRGTVTVQISGSSWNYNASNVTSYEYRDGHWRDDKVVVDTETFEVAKGDQIVIAVNPYNALEATDLTVSVSFEYGLGTESNPELITFTWTSDIRSEATVVIPANTAPYYIGISTGMWGDSMDLYLDGDAFGPVSGTPWQPYVIELGNETDEPFTRTLALEYPLGHQMNPAELVLGENTASIEAGNSQGYFYTFTVPATGTLILNISAETGWTYQINNLTTYQYGDTQCSDSEPVVNPAEIEVSEGDELQIMVNTYDPADMWNNPAGTVTLNVNYPLGSDLNPDQLTFDWISDISSQAAVVVPANSSYYVAISTGMWGDTMILTIDGEEYGPVSGTPWQPCVIELANDTDADVTKTLVLTYPVGSQMNPDTLNVYTEGESWDESEGENIATVEADSWTGYQYYWTAPVAGELTINVSNGKAGWAYTVNNVTGCKYGDSHYSSDVPAQNSETIMVSAGDEIQVVINSCGEAGATSPAGEVYFYATFNPYAGTEENPISVTFVEYDMYWNTVLVPVTVTVPANTTYYYQSYGISGMLLSINGGEGTLLSGGNPRMPVTFSVTNDTEAEAEYTLTVAYPAGNQMNPAELMDYENVAKIEAGSQGYYYTWTAADKGTLTIEISAADDAGWTYVLNNLTTYQYGDTQWSDSDPVVNTATIEVNKGDEIQLIVNTYDPADMWSNPAGTITVYAYAEYDAGTESNPEMVFFNMNDDYLSGWLNVTVPANTTYYYQSYGIGGMYMNVMNADGEQIDGYTLPSVMGRQPVVFSVTNSSDEAAEYILQIYYPIGSQMNPEQVYWTGYCGAYIEEGNSSGYYYQITAQITGSVEIELDEIYPEGVEADIIVFNNTTYSQKTLSADGVDGVLTLDVTAGDVLDVQIVVMPDASWNYPEANILWKYDYVAGTEGNPDWMYLGKNSFKIEANDEDGYYLKGYVEEPGYVTITMTSSNWSYSVGYWKSVYDDEGDEIGRELVWTEVQASNVKGAKKSQTIYLDGGNYFLHINTANGKAATVSFTVTHASKVVEVAAGKPVTLTFTDPSTGKAVSASEATWEITEIYTADDAEDYAAYASVANGKLTTVASAITEPIQIVVKAVLKDGTAENTFQIFVYPAVTSIQINTNKVENDMWVVDEENVTELTYVANGDNDIYLSTVIGPDNALIDVTWKSSNTKILNVYQSYYYDDNGEHQYVGLEYVYNSKTDKIATGTVTLTATANDGSGVKATVKVNVVMETKWVDISTKNDQFVIAPGKSVTMIADLKTWYNQTPTNKAVEWSLGEMIVWNYETNEWETYAPGEGQTPVVTLSNKGVLKAASTADKIYQIQVIATAQDTGVSNYSWMAVMPLAKTVQIYGIPATYNLYSGEEIRPSVEIRDKNGNDCWSGYKWTTSNKKIAEVVAVEEYNEEYDSYYSYYVVNFTGKTGKVTLTATATDGSNVKKAVTVNVVKGVAEVILPETVSVGTGKSVNLNKSVSVNPTDVTNKKVTWSWATDEDKAVADSLKVTLNASGTLSAAKLKTVTDTVTLSVKATAADGLGACGYTTVVIRPATTKVTLYRFHKAVSGTLSLDDDDVMVLHANSLPESAVQEYTWKSSNVKIATVEANPDGSVTVRPTGKLGSVTITATAADGSNKSAKVTVKVVKKVDSLTIADNAGVAATKSLNLNKSLTINPTNASNKKVTWSWGNDASAAWAKDNKVTLSASGTLSAAKLKTLTAPKTLNVKVTAADGFGAYDYASVTIYPATTSVALVNTDGSVIAKTGETVSYKRGSWQMSAVGTPEGVVMDQYKWTSSNVKIATVDQNGLVTFTGKVGSVTIKATATDGTNKYAQTTIKVVKFVESLSWTNDYFLSVAKGKTVTLSKVVSIQPADATNKALVWTMELVEYDAETGAYVTKGDGVVSSKMATLNKSTGALKTVNVSDLEYVRVTCTPADDPTGMNAISQIVVLAPNAIKGIQLLQEQEDGTKVNMAKKTISTTESSVKLYPEATNASTDKPASDWTFTVSNKNFEVLWDGVNMVVRATSDAANPYGTVKVTVKATDGSNVSTYVTIKFVKPVAEATLN